MSWLRKDDGFFDHPKIRSLSLAAYVLHDGGLLMSARLETDGALTTDQLYGLTRKGLNPHKVAPELVAAGLWYETDDGYRIHDFLDFNPSKEQNRERRRKDSERKAAARSAKSPNGHASDSVASLSYPDPTRPLGDKSVVKNTRAGDV